ncbi:MAG: DUF5719 family protein, partial [Acidimicrobiales bacterium]
RSTAWRWPVLAFVAAALVVAGLVDAAVGTATPAAPAALASAGAPATSESSSWYCTGGSGTSGGPGGATLYLVDSGPRAVRGTVTVVNDAGARASTGVTVPAGGQAVVATDQVEQGTWLAATVDLDGGGVVVSELVEGSSGWAEAPCASTTSTQWYFASGATTNGNSLYVSVFNPASSPAVVDLAFATPAGVMRPQPFEGMVVAPGQLVVAGVASYVQDRSSVATIVRARSGRVVASELQVRDAGGRSGLSLRLGSPAPQATWTVPRTVHVTGSDTTLEVFNPTARAQKVTVSVHLPSGPVAPYVQQVAPDATWALDTGRSTRIPANTDFATTVTASGPGVVVDREVAGPTCGAAPQWGTVAAVGGSTTAVGSRRWILPTADAPATPAEAGAAPFALALQNPGAGDVTVTVDRLTPAGPRRLGRVPTLRIPGGAFTVVEPTTLGKAGTDPLVVRSSGPVSAMEDATPAAMPGVVALAGVPQSS